MAGRVDGLALVAPTGNAVADAINTVRTSTVTVLGDTVLPRRTIDFNNSDDANHVKTVVPSSLQDMVNAKKRYLFGVSFNEVATQAVLALAAARALGAPQVLLHDMVFSVFVGYTVARDWAVEYNNLNSGSVLRRFEIDGRTIDRSDPMFNKSAWVSTSRMNATAAHLFAYLIIEAAPAGGVLAKIKSIKGTPFSDAQRATPQGLIITELAKTLDREDREASAKFAREFAVLARVVDLVFGEAGADLDGAIAKAIKFKPAEF